MYMYVYIYICRPLASYIARSLFKDLRGAARRYVYIYIYICIYIYIYIHTYIHTYTSTHMHTCIRPFCEALCGDRTGQPRPHSEYLSRFVRSPLATRCYAIRQLRIMNVCRWEWGVLCGPRLALVCPDPGQVFPSSDIPSTFRGHRTD